MFQQVLASRLLAASAFGLGCCGKLPNPASARGFPMRSSRTHASETKPIPMEFANFASPDLCAWRSRLPTGVPRTIRRPTESRSRLHNAGAVAGFRPAKYLVIAMLGVLMTTLIACGASAELEGGDSSSSAAAAPSVIPTNAPTAGQPAPATPTDAPTAAMLEPTLAPTDAPPQAMPTDTPLLTFTAEPATATPEPTQAPEPTVSPEELIAAILTPPSGADLDGVWWWKPAGRPRYQSNEFRFGHPGDHTPEVVITEHPYGPQLDLMDGNFDHFPNIASKGRRFPPAPEFYVQRPLGWILDDITLELVEAEGLNIANIGTIKDTDLLESFLKTAGWEIVHNEETVVRFWGTLSAPSLKHDYRIGFTVKYQVVSEPSTFLSNSLVRRQGGYPIKEFLGEAVHDSPYVLQRVE